MKFSETDVHELSNIIGLIYETILDRTILPKVLELICGFLKAKVEDYRRDARIANSQTYYSWGFDQKFLDIYTEKFLTLNPLYPAPIFITPGEIFSSGDLVTFDDLQASRFFRDWVAQRH